MVSLQQVHSDTILSIRSLPQEDLQGDALLCDQPGYLLVIKTADCLPIFLVDPVRKALAAVHCGWRGTGHRLIQKVVQRMQAEFGSQPQFLLAGLGPCIESKCYEVEEDVRKSFSSAGISSTAFLPISRKPGKYFLDLKSANKNLLQELGVPKENFFSVNMCTLCESDLYSYRRERQKAGRLINFIALIA